MSRRIWLFAVWTVAFQGVGVFPRVLAEPTPLAEAPTLRLSSEPTGNEVRDEFESAPGAPRLLGRPTPSPINETPSHEEALVPFRFRDDLRCFPRQFASDTKSLLGWQTGLSLALGGTFAAVSANNWDDDVRRYTLGHERRWGGANNLLDVAGHPLTHLGATSALYGVSLITQDETFHDFSLATLNALILTDLTVIALKYSFDTTRPNGDRYGFPSGHVASSFAVAACVREYYGEWAGLAADILAVLVAWNRIDDRRHDLSDVIFGAALGAAIGMAVAENHNQDRNWTMSPYVDPDQGVGVLFAVRY